MRHSTHIRALLALLAAIATVGLLAACGSDDGDDESSLKGADEAAERFEGLDQNGTQIGDPQAKAGVVVYVDLQSPESAKFFADELPGVIDRHVRNGEIVLQLRPIPLLGPDSRLAQGWAAGAQLQNRIWEFSDVFFANQGEPDSGYVTDAFLADVAEAAGADPAEIEAALGGEAAEGAIADNDGTARALKVDEVPDFYLYEIGAEKPVRMVLDEPTVEGFSDALEAARNAG